MLCFLPQRQVQQRRFAGVGERIGLRACAERAVLAQTRWQCVEHDLTQRALVIAGAKTGQLHPACRKRRRVAQNGTRIAQFPRINVTRLAYFDDDADEKLLTEGNEYAPADILFVRVVGAIVKQPRQRNVQRDQEDVHARGDFRRKLKPVSAKNWLISLMLMKFSSSTHFLWISLWIVL